MATPDNQPLYANSYALVVVVDVYSGSRLVPFGSAEADAACASTCRLFVDRFADSR